MKPTQTRGNPAPPWRLALGLAALLASAGAARGSEPLPVRLLLPVSATAPDQALFAEAVLRRANAERAARGLPPLVHAPDLAQAAADHARNMATLRRHAHTLPVPGQETYTDRLRQRGVRFRDAAENIARGKLYRLLGRPISSVSEGCAFTYADTGAPVPVHSYLSLAEEVVARWLASPAHAAALLSPGHARAGAGLAGDPAAPGCGDLYMAQTLAD